MEDYKPIEGFPEYFISKDGVVYSSKTNRILRSALWNSGYLSVNLSSNGVLKSLSIHRLVAVAFCENKYKKDIVNHKDGNKLNNNYKNLEWVTRTENAVHARDTLNANYGHGKTMRGRFGKDHNRSCMYRLSKDGEEIVFNSGLEAKRAGFENTSLSFYRNVLPHTFKRGKLKGYTLLEVK